MSNTNEECCDACVLDGKECIWKWVDGKDPVWNVQGNRNPVPPMGRHSYCVSQMNPKTKDHPSIENPLSHLPAGCGLNVARE